MPPSLQIRIDPVIVMIQISHVSDVTIGVQKWSQVALKTHIRPLGTNCVGVRARKVPDVERALLQHKQAPVIGSRRHVIRANGPCA